MKLSEEDRKKFVAAHALWEAHRERMRERDSFLALDLGTLPEVDGATYCAPYAFTIDMLVSIRVNECYSFQIPLSVLAGKCTGQSVLLDLLTADEVFELEGYVGGMVLAFEQWLPGFEVETKFNGYSVAYRTDPGTLGRCLMVDRRGRWVNVYQADYAEKAALVQGMHSLVSELRSAVTAARSSLGVIRSWRDKP